MIFPQDVCHRRGVSSGFDPLYIKLSELIDVADDFFHFTLEPRERFRSEFEPGEHSDPRGIEFVGSG